MCDLCDQLEQVQRDLEDLEEAVARLEADNGECDAVGAGMLSVLRWQTYYCQCRGTMLYAGICHVCKKPARFGLSDPAMRTKN